MESKKIYEISKFDFYSGSKNSFLNRVNDHNAVLVRGNHRSPAPLVSILIPTFKRPDLLKEAIESALNQKDIKDYQIIVADNEGERGDKQTETSRLMMEYEDEKIIYYRYDRQAFCVMDSIASLARSKWICFLHDDDVLAPNFLSIMVKVIEKEKRIPFLSCDIASLEERISERNINYFSNSNKKTIRIGKDIKWGYYFFQGRANWIGALINRELYINMGGMTELSTGVGDYTMVGKFNAKYSVYRILDGPILYFRRNFADQLSSKGVDVWTDCYTSELLFYKYLARTYYPYARRFFEFKGFNMIKNNIEFLSRSYYRTTCDLQKIKQNCRLKDFSEKEKVRYFYLDCIIKTFMVFWMKSKKTITVEIG